MRLIVYSKKGCPFCSLLKAELATRRITYEEFDLSDDAVRALFYENSGKKSVPQIYLTEGEATLTSPSGESLGGWSDVSKSLGTLADRLAAS
jgi:glutaredoxin